MRPKVKYAVIYRHRNEYSVSVMCKFFEVSRSGCYDFVRRIGQTESDAGLAKKIQECQGRADKPYGYRLKLNISYIGSFCAVRINWGSPRAAPALFPPLPDASYILSYCFPMILPQRPACQGCGRRQQTLLGGLTFGAKGTILRVTGGEPERRAPARPEYRKK